MEETGCKATGLKLVGVSSSLLKAKGINWRVIRIIYKGKINGKIRVDEDHSDYAFWTLEKPVKQNIAKVVKKALLNL